MEERCERSHFGGMVLAVVVGGMILHRLSEHKHCAMHGSHHERFAKMWKRHHARFHDWAECCPPEDSPEEKAGDAA
ncbi:MAG: hypothetical protein JXA21_27145 [Anaerolineae bacterium]|nr:hypothetical protein [Anaerolineae bacterium]